MLKDRPGNSDGNGSSGEIVIRHNPPKIRSDPGTKIKHDKPQAPKLVIDRTKSAPQPKTAAPAVASIQESNELALKTDQPTKTNELAVPDTNVTAATAPVQKLPSVPPPSIAEDEKVIATQKEEIEIQNEQIKLLKDLVDTFDTKHELDPTKIDAIIDKSKFFERQAVPEFSAPTTEASPQPALPTNNGVTPVPMTAPPPAVLAPLAPAPVVSMPVPQAPTASSNTAAAAPSAKKFPSIIFMAVAAVVILGLLVAAVLFLSKNSYKTDSLTNNNYVYSFSFDSNANAARSGGQNYLTGYDLKHQNVIGVLAGPGSYSQLCDQHFQPINIAFVFTFQAIEYPVCTLSNSYSDFTNIQFNGSWQQITIYSVNQRTPVDSTTAKTILDSLKISQK